jgi:hypothetical protein
MYQQLEIGTLTNTKNVDLLSVSHSQMDVKDFLELKPVSVQRNEVDRYKKTMKVLMEKLLPTHLEVSIVIPNFEDEYYEFGKPYSINGNTRKYIWSNYPEIRPNKNLYVTIYQANTRKEIDEIYRSIDSQDSVETPKQMIGGIFRDTNQYPISKYVKSGKFSTALRHAYSCYMGDRSRINYEKNSFLEMKNRKEFELFRDEIFFLDKFYYEFETDKSKVIKYNFSSVFSALLIVCKKYGINNPKVEELVNNLTSGKTTIHEGINGVNDGLSVINQELYEYYQNVLQKWSDTSAGHGPVIIGNLIYCMDSYMNDVLLKIKKSGSRMGIVMKDDKSKEYFVNYFKN